MPIRRCSNLSFKDSGSSSPTLSPNIHSEKWHFIRPSCAQESASLLQSSLSPLISVYSVSYLPAAFLVMSSTQIERTCTLFRRRTAYRSFRTGFKSLKVTHRRFLLIKANPLRGNCSYAQKFTAALTAFKSLLAFYMHSFTALLYSQRTLWCARKCWWVIPELFLIKDTHGEERSANWATSESIFVIRFGLM